MAEETPPVVAPAAAETENQKRTRVLFNQLWNDPKHGAEVRKRAKELYPDLTLPEEPLEPVLGPLRAELDELKTSLATEREERAKEKAEAAEASAAATFERRAAESRAKYSLTPEGFDAMIEHMRETENYTDFDGAAAWVAGQQPKPVQPGPYLGPQSLNILNPSEKDERLRLLWKDPTGAFLDAEFGDFIANPRQYIMDAGFDPDR
jgi:hypothetical protein